MNYFNLKQDVTQKQSDLDARLSLLEASKSSILPADSMPAHINA